MTDQSDGSYHVSYKVEQSGPFLIVISLYGEQLRGSPFVCNAVTPTPVAELCVVRGDALHNAVARVQQVFEVQFRDALNQVACVQCFAQPPLHSQVDARS